MTGGSLKKMLRNCPPCYRLARRLYPFATLLAALPRGRRGSWDHLRSSFSLLRGSNCVAGRPVSLTLEPTNVCNLRCPVCETGSGELGRSPRAMTLAEFRAILGKVGKHTNSLLFYYMGEPFLNPHAYQMIRLAKDAGIPWVNSCTNGELVDPGQLVECGLDEVSFQIGGMSAGTHGIYRVNGNLEHALENLRETLRLRRERKRRLRVNCGMILMRHNEHEAELFKKSMADLGVDEATVVDPCVRTVAQGESFLPSDRSHWYYDPEAFRSGTLRPRIPHGNRCDWLYYSLTVLANGDVVPCCRDPRGSRAMGNLLEQELAEIWNSSQFRAFRRQVLTAQSELELCRLCSGYPAAALR